MILRIQKYPQASALRSDLHTDSRLISWFSKMFVINPAIHHFQLKMKTLSWVERNRKKGEGVGPRGWRTHLPPNFHPPPRVENGPEQGSRKRNLTTGSFPCWQMWEGILGVSQKLFGWCFRAAYANFQGWAESTSLLQQRKQLKPKGLAGTWESKEDRVWQFWGSKSKFLTQTWRSLTLSLYSLLYQIFLCPFALCPCLHLTLKCYLMLKNAQNWDSSFHLISYPIFLISPPQH